MAGILQPIYRNYASHVVSFLSAAEAARLQIVAKSIRLFVLDNDAWEVSLLEPSSKKSTINL